MKKTLMIVFSILIAFTIIFPSSNYIVEASRDIATNLDDENKFYTINENGEVVSLDTTPVQENQDEIVAANNNALKVKNQRSAKTETFVLKLRVKPTAHYNTNYTTDIGNGYINGFYGGDAAVKSFDNNGVNFVISGVEGYMKSNDGTYNNYKLIPYSNAKSVSHYYVSDNNLYHKIAKDVELSNSYLGTYNVGNKPNYLSENKTYYSYDGHYFYTNYATMISDYNAGHRNNSINSSQPYFNYYQFLSTRSQTNLTATDFNNYIASKSSTSVMRNMGQSFINAQNTYGVNALLAFAHAILESGYGESNYAINNNNIFGIGAGDADPDNAYKFTSVSVCINEYAKLISNEYCDYLDYINRFHGTHYGDKSGGINVAYASDPYSGEKIASIAMQVDSNAKDKDAYQIGIAEKQYNLNIRKEATTSSNILYTTKNHQYFPFIILSKTNDWYKVRSDSTLASDRNKIQQDKYVYSFTNDYAYVNSQYVKLVNISSNQGGNSNSSNVTGEPTGKDENDATLYYRANTQQLGWLDLVNEPNSAGTTGRSLSLYQLQLDLRNVNSGVSLNGKVYSADGSWQTYTNIKPSTSIGKNEIAMKIVNFNITGLKGYKLQYRVHSSTIGWQDWVDAGKNAGNENYNIQAIDFRLIKEKEPLVSYQTHIQGVGWQNWKANGEMSGTSGQSKRLEGINIKLTDAIGGIEYQTHIQGIGWQNWKANGEMSGTSGQSKRLEAIRIRLTGKIAEEYDVYYRVHAQQFGWLDWAKNGESAGTATYGYRLEGIEVKLVRKGEAAPGNTTTPYHTRNISYQTHVQRVGWQENKYDGEMSGTSGRSLRLEGIKIALADPQYSGGIEYQTHVQTYGWQNWKSNGAVNGTSGESKRLEAIRIRLTGKMAEKYDVYYRVHAQQFGWMGWSKNGENAGSAGYSYRLEGIQIRLVPKGASAPGSTDNAYREK